VGTIGIVDFDIVEASNLQRQIIHSSDGIGRAKAASAGERIKSLNPYVNVVEHMTRLTSRNALGIIQGYDVVADGTDNYPTRYLVNDACTLLGIPSVYGSVSRFEGQASVFYPKEGPCYRCLYPVPPPPGMVPACGEAGVMGVLPGVIGAIQAGEAIKLIVGGEGSLIGRLLSFDAWGMKFRELKLEKDPGCPICGENRSIHELIDYEQFCGLKPNATDEPIETLTPHEFKARLDAGSPIQIIDIRAPQEQALAEFPDARALPPMQVAEHIDEFDEGIDTVVLCAIGQRSIFVICALREAGYRGRLFNLAGGVNAWLRDIGEGKTDHEGRS
jgi:adenylyltransferase/sulfurtransferase